MERAALQHKDVAGAPPPRGRVCRIAGPLPDAELTRVLLRERHLCSAGTGARLPEDERILGMIQMRCPFAGIVMARNRLAAHKAHGGWALPPPIQSPFSCRSCMALTTCALVHKALEGGDGESFGLPEQFEAVTRHVTPADSAFLHHWLGLLELETDANAAPQAHIWALDPPPALCEPALEPSSEAGSACGLVEYGLDARRAAAAVVPDATATQCDAGDVPPASATVSGKAASEDAVVAANAPCDAGTEADGAASDGVAQRRHPLAGRCVGHLLLGRYAGPSDAFPLYPHAYVFTQAASNAAGSAQQLLQKGLHEQGFAEGDAGVLSVQGGHPAVNRARVVAVDARSLTVACRSRMAALERLAGQGGNGGAPLAHGTHVATGASAAPPSPLLWRLDRDESDTVQQSATAGLLELCSGQGALLSRLRGLIVHLKPPARAARDTYALEAPVEPDCFDEMLAAECAPHALHVLCIQAITVCSSRARWPAV
jgi:hypothetical protein